MKILGWTVTIMGLLALAGSFVVLWRLVVTGNPELATGGFFLLIYGLIQFFMGRSFIKKAKNKRIEASHEQRRERELHRAE